MIANDASHQPHLPSEAPTTLEAAWREAGGTPAAFRQRRPIPLSEYEESKLNAAGVDLTKSRVFFAKAKALMGERDFELFIASEEERALERSSSGRPVQGRRLENPTGLLIRYTLKSIAEGKIMNGSPASNGSTSANLPRSNATTPEVVFPPLPSMSKTKHARASRALELVDKVQQASGEMQSTDVVYCSSAFVVASLPHSDPGMRETWSRTNGKRVLTVRSGYDDTNQCQFGLPYGSLPRLMYYYVESEVIRKGEQKIHLGDSLYGFMRSLGISDSAPNYRAMRSQAARLFNASFQITEKKTAGAGALGVNIKHVPPIAKEAEFWWHTDRKAGQTGELFSSYVVLEDKFYQEMLEHGFPLDANAVKYLRQSSLDLDVYAWISHRNYSLNQFDRESVEISFEALMEQFGSEYARARDFRAKLKQALRKIGDVWRGDFNYELTKTGLVLKKSPLQIKAAPRRAALL